MWAAETPTDVAIYLMLRVAGAPYEFETQHEVSIKLVDPERRAQHFGLYTLDVFLDDRRQRSVPILVRDANELQRA